jgi:hypothetical protein
MDAPLENELGAAIWTKEDDSRQCRGLEKALAADRVRWEKDARVPPLQPIKRGWHSAGRV